MASVGLILQAGPVPFLLSSQFRRWAPLPTRIAFAAVYVAIPNAREIHIVCTNSQWHLALIMALLAFTEAPQSLAAKVFELAVITIGAVTGPFALVLVPLVAIFWYVRRLRWTAIVLSILSAGAIVQVFTLLSSSSQRPLRGHLGASLSLFFRLLGGNCFMGALLGSHRFGLKLPLVCSALMFAIGLGLCVYCARFLSAGVRLFFVFCFGLFLAGLRMPAIQPNPTPMWMLLLEIPSQRYLFFPSLPFLFAILWCAGYARNRMARISAIALAPILCIGVWSDWRVPSLPPMDLHQQAAILKAARPGEHVVLDEYPPGWSIYLVKR